MAFVFPQASDYLQASQAAGVTNIAGQALTNQVLAAYQRTAMFALRDQTIFDALPKVRPGNLTSPGTPVNFLFWDDIAAATTALLEEEDVSAVATSDSTTSVAPSEYGNAILVSRRIKADNFLIGFDSDLANLVAFNMVDTMDTLARNLGYDAGTNVTYVGGGPAKVNIAATDIVTADAFRQQQAILRSANVVPAEGGLYWALIDPYVAYDLKSETGDGAWVAPAQFVNTEKIHMNEIGVFGGFRFVETNRALNDADAGVGGTVDVYTTYLLGQEAVAKAEPIPAHIVLGPVTDRLQRFQPLGWHAYVGWAPLRGVALSQLFSASSIGANS